VPVYAANPVVTDDLDTPTNLYFGDGALSYPRSLRKSAFWCLRMTRTAEMRFRQILDSEGWRVRVAPDTKMLQTELKTGEIFPVDREYRHGRRRNQRFFSGFFANWLRSAWKTVPGSAFFFVVPEMSGKPVRSSD